MPVNEDLIKRLGKLQSTLLTSGLQKENQPLYQVISQLIKAIIESNVGIVDAVSSGDLIGPPGADGDSIEFFEQSTEPLTAETGDFWFVTEP